MVLNKKIFLKKKVKKIQDKIKLMEEIECKLFRKILDISNRITFQTNLYQLLIQAREVNTEFTKMEY